MLETLDLANIISEQFMSGCKNELKMGIEFERIPIDINTHESVPYDGENGICRILKDFSRMECWDYITDNGVIIGLQNDNDTITLEPGCQFELSLEPNESIGMIKNKIDRLNQKLTPILKKHNVKLLEYGISPKTTYRHVGLLPKRRYHLMANYLWGILSDVMMRETAGIQICIDFKSEHDAIRKFRLANILSPFVTAMCANSPIRGGVDTGYKSFRALSWLNTDNERCGFACNLDDDFSFEKYIDAVIKSPVILLNKDDNVFDINGEMDFEQYMKEGFGGYDAVIEDFMLHANLYFPEVRLRNFIEIRNHDCTSVQYSLLAIYKGILYNETAMNDIEELLKLYSHPDISDLRYSVPKSALQTKIKKFYVGDIAKEIINIAEHGLEASDETKFLEPIKEYTMKGLCPADVILRNWNGSWNKDISKLIKYILDKKSL